VKYAFDFNEERLRRLRERDVPVNAYDDESL
jgi:hypothetical protein